MRIMKVNTPLFAALILLMLSNIPAFAHTTRARELCGTINQFDSDQEVQFKSERSGKVRNFVLRKNAMVLKDWKLTDRAAVIPGERACVYYRSPFFGKPFITKVLILNEGERCPPGRGGLFDRHKHD